MGGRNWGQPWSCDRVSAGPSEALRGEVGVRGVGWPVSWEGGGGWLRRGWWGMNEPLGGPSRVGADLQGPQKLVAAFDACDVEKQVDGP